MSSHAQLRERLFETPKAGRRVALIGAPSDVGAGHRGGCMGPEALRVAGLTRELAGLGVDVDDWGNLAGPANPCAPAREGCRHLKETVSWCAAVRDQVYAALGEQRLPILLGGDHALSVGSIAGVAKHCAEVGRPLSVVWLDAHADFNTPESSESGNIHGMPVAVLDGKGPKELTGLGHDVPILPSNRVIQIGIRSVDHVEKRAVLESGLSVYDMRTIDERGMRTVMDEALARATADGAHLHVSFDVDFLDPMIAPGVGTTVPGGPSYREAQLCMEMIHDAGGPDSLDIMELNPAFDHGNKTAELAVEMTKSLFGEQILARHFMQK
ncbi:MAG: arginase [Rhodovibrionaceae bacterium]|nr:arginase [Rhodovibrionaceae bacterium]